MRLPDPQRSRAVLLGVDTFADPGLPDLPAVARNVDDLAEVLTSPRGTALPDRHCVRRRERESSGLADSASIGARLVSAAREAEDLLLVYYAGHGLVGPDGELYLSLPGTRSEPDLVPWTAIPFGLVRRALANARADNRVLILDCCFSGRAIDVMTGTASVVAGQLEVAGTCTLASSPANRPSHAPSDARHTAYTGELLALLRHGSADAGEFLTLQTIHEHLARALPAKGHPRPELRGTHTVGRLALARNQVHSGISDPEAMVKEATRLERVGDGAGAVHWFREAANAGRSDAMRELGRLLERDGSRAEAALWRRRAGEFGDPTAMYDLGVASWHTGDLPQAESWLRKAAAAGLPEATEDLEKLLRRRR
ncbi:caspase, EACC1-associated type [Streptomyces sp. BBFR109]|uniref:caspase, EACC1-associated type n=1 Tax=Streptomyces sp. BBFR109 TaxID=3448172 RepID=UPI003F776519